VPCGIGLLIDGGSVLLWHSLFFRKVCVLAAIVPPVGLAGAVNAERKASHSSLASGLQSLPHVSAHSHTHRQTSSRWLATSASTPIHSSSRAAEAQLGQGANDLSQTCPLVRLPRNGGIKWHRLSAWRWLLIWGRLRCTDVGSQRHIKMCSTYCWCCSLRTSQCRRQQHRRSSCSRVHSLPNRGHGAAMAPSHRA